jgi:hypothetical protein
MQAECQPLAVHFFTVAVPVSRPAASRKVIVPPRARLLPVIRPEASR